VATAAASLALSLVAAEFLYRAAERAAYGRALARYSHELVALLPPPRYYRCHPNLELAATIEGDGQTTRVVYHTDAEGWRRQPSVPATPATRRVLCLGDSYTFGLAVDDADTYPARLQADLRQRGLDVAVENLGVPGYDTEQELHTLHEVFGAMAPHAVVVGYVMNDAEPTVMVPPAPQERFRYCRSWLLEACRPAIAAAALVLVSDRPCTTLCRVEAARDYRTSFAWSSPKWRASRDALVAMHAFLEARGVPLLVFVLPDFTQRFDPTYEFTLLHERVAQWGASAGFPVFDLLPVFLGEDHRALWVPGDGHPNPQAQARLAAAMVAPLLAVLR